MTDYLDKIATLDRLQIFGWWDVVMRQKFRTPHPGEVAALYARANALGVELPAAMRDTEKSSGGSLTRSPPL